MEAEQLLQIKLEETYALGRTCRHCAARIGDSVNGNRQFCEEYYNEYGIRINCKDRYFGPRFSDEMAPFKKLAFYYRDVNRSIQELISEDSDIISLEAINRKGIELERNLKLVQHKKRLYTFYFPLYAFEQLDSNHFKIISHELF